MISKSQNEALLIIGNAATKNKQWLQYAQYCFNRDKGLRKDAFENLNDTHYNVNPLTKSHSL